MMPLSPHTHVVQGQRVLFFDETVANWAIILETYNTMSCMELQKVVPSASSTPFPHHMPVSLQSPLTLTPSRLQVSLVITEDADDGRVAEGVAIPQGEFDAGGGLWGRWRSC